MAETGRPSGMGGRCDLANDPKNSGNAGRPTTSTVVALRAQCDNDIRDLPVSPDEEETEVGRTAARLPRSPSTRPGRYTRHCFVLQVRRVGQLTLLQKPQNQLPLGTRSLGGMPLGMLHACAWHCTCEKQFRLPQCRQIQSGPCPWKRVVPGGGANPRVRRASQRTDSTGAGNRGVAVTEGDRCTARPTTGSDCGFNALTGSDPRDNRAADVGTDKEKE